MEGSCIVQSARATWEVGFYREGTPKRDLFGRTNNLVILFRPAGEDHKVHSWWDEVVGPDKPIDTTKWMVLSLGVVGDGIPKVGEATKLSLAEILDAQRQVLAALFPYRTTLALVAGVSQGADVALAWGKAFGKDINKLLLVAGGLLTPKQNQNAGLDAAIKKYLTYELTHGTYDSWPSEGPTSIKRQFWIDAVDTILDGMYPPDYFDSPKNMTDVGLTASDFKSREHFRGLMREQWADWYLQRSHPVWQIAQLEALKIEGSRLPITKGKQRLGVKHITYVGIKGETAAQEEQSIERELIRIKKLGVNSEFNLFENAKGHAAVYTPNVDPSILKYIREYLR